MHESLFDPAKYATFEEYLAAHTDTSPVEQHIPYSYDPDDISEYEALQKELQQQANVPRPRRELQTYAQNKEEFLTKRQDYIRDFISENTEFFLKFFEPYGNSEVERRHAIKILAHFFFGIHLIRHRYDAFIDDPKTQRVGRSVGYSPSNDPKSAMFRCHYGYNDEISISSYQINIPKFLDFCKNPHTWQVGPVPSLPPEDLVLFTGIEEAAHSIFAVVNKVEIGPRPAPESLDYYADDIEYQALKTMVFMAGRYFSADYYSKFKNKLLEMRGYLINKRSVSLPLTSLPSPTTSHTGDTASAG